MIEDFIEETEPLWPTERLLAEFEKCEQSADIVALLSEVQSEYEAKFTALRTEVKELYENYMYTSGKWSGD